MIKPIDPEKVKQAKFLLVCLFSAAQLSRKDASCHSASTTVKFAEKVADEILSKHTPVDL